MKTTLLMGAIGTPPSSSPAAMRALCAATCRQASTTCEQVQQARGHSHAADTLHFHVPINLDGMLSSTKAVAVSRQHERW